MQDYHPPVTTRVYASNGTVLGEYARERRIFVPIAFVPKLVIEAFTSAEDKNFFTHPGIDPGGIIRAAVKDVFNVLEHRRLEGASTITQQVAKNFLLNSDVKFSRKIREAILAIRIDATYPKEKILELYLNEIFLGENSYGVAAAALNYFGKSLDQLDIAEVAFLATLPKAPSNYDPRFHHAGGARPAQLGDRSDGRQWLHHRRSRPPTPRPSRWIAQMRPLGSQAEDADYFVEEVRRILYAKYGEQALYDDGLQVRSTLDTRAAEFRGERAAHRACALRPPPRLARRGQQHRHSRRLEGDAGERRQPVGHRDVARSRWCWPMGRTNPSRSGSTMARPESFRSANSPGRARNCAIADVGAAPTRPQDVLKIGDVVYVEPLDDKPGEFGLRQVPEVNGAIVSMDPHTGRVLAMSGGFSYASSQFDRAMQAMRQPGSSFKPFVYAAALDNGYTPASRLLDAPVVAAARARPADVDAQEFREQISRPHHAAARHRAVAQPADHSPCQRHRHGQGGAVCRALRRLRHAARLICPMPSARRKPR